MKKVFLLMFLSLMVITAVAAPRDKASMQAAAAQAINGHRANMKKAPRQGAIKELLKTNEYSIMGYENGGFAIISADDLAPEVLGVSSNKYSEGKNENFNWWLKMVKHAVASAVASNIPLTTTTPAALGYPTHVGPLMTTEWDQLTPYNNMCPNSVYGDRCYTGCVATAMAQVLNYFKTPVQGIGSRTITFPKTGYNQNSKSVSTNFGEHVYDWANMRDTYISGQYTTAEANAVAQLMLDCGVAADMDYGGSYEGGSGAYSQDAAAGIRTYFGIETAECLERDYFSESDWMDRVYQAISEDGPIYYGGASYSSGGHAFVLHGYREDGKVYVNWGWSGDDDGYYDIAVLNPGYYHFEMQQDMIVGIRGNNSPVELVDCEVELTTAGSLAAKLGDIDPLSVARLTVKGRVNSSDLKLIREMGGVDQTGKSTKGHLTRLYMKEAVIVPGGEAYLIEDGQAFTTTADELPYKAFYGARSLRKIELPDVISYGYGVMAATNIDSIGFAEHKMETPQTFIIEDDVIYDAADQTIIIGSLPTLQGNMVIKEGTTILRPYALSGISMTKFELPASLVSIEQQALERCAQLREIKTNAKVVPEVGTNAFSGVDQSDCKLFVPAGTKSDYSRAQGWKEFTQIKEFGTTIKARNATREYGEKNPTFGYLLQGDYVSGRAELVCEATETSPVGEYLIIPQPGTITAKDVEYEPGILTITPAPLSVTVEDATRRQYEDDPEWVFTATGLKNEETVADAFTVLPVVTSSADKDSPEGEYVLSLSGGEAPNYNVTYTDGKLIIEGVVDGITLPTVYNQQSVIIYNLEGQRVTNPKKGIYIINGKKVVLK